MTWFDGWILNVGAGGTLVKLENCVEAEYSIFRNTDVVTDAHHLPFADAAFDAVVSFNTFEHLYDPNAAAAEISRVLKPGGRLIVHTAFLQPVHEPPHHYYNVTEYGLRKWFEAFDISSVSVSENFQPAHVLALAGVGDPPGRRGRAGAGGPGTPGGQLARVLAVGLGGCGESVAPPLGRPSATPPGGPEALRRRVPARCLQARSVPIRAPMDPHLPIVGPPGSTARIRRRSP